MSNIQVTLDTDPNDARCESIVAINPTNLSHIVAASKKFRDLHTYDFTLATTHSQDGGLTWPTSADSVAVYEGAGWFAPTVSPKFVG